MGRMGWSSVYSPFVTALRRRVPAGDVSLRGVRIVTLSFVVLGLAQLPAAPAALAQEQADPSTVKVVILSRHGVRSPIPSPDELATWTASSWPTWHCDDGDCKSGQFTPNGWLLAEQMGTHYQTYLSRLLPAECPQQDQVFFWADNAERTEDTGYALLHGFRSSPSCNTKKLYFHTTSAKVDRIFHPVTSAGPCRLDPERAEAEILSRAKTEYSSSAPTNEILSIVTKALDTPLKTIQNTLQCCRSLCQTTWEKTCRLPAPPPNVCTLTDRLPSCLVRITPRNKEGDLGAGDQPVRVELGGALRVASTFSEILLLEYANKFP
jgi:hypothetical protein